MSDKSDGCALDHLDYKLKPKQQVKHSKLSINIVKCKLSDQIAPQLDLNAINTSTTNHELASKH